jgi:hypothetical protein
MIIELMFTISSCEGSGRWGALRKWELVFRNLMFYDTTLYIRFNLISISKDFILVYRRPQSGEICTRSSSLGLVFPRMHLESK